MQGAQARAALESLKADKGSLLKALPPRVYEALCGQPLQRREAVRRSSATIGRAINATMHRCWC